MATDSAQSTTESTLESARMHIARMHVAQGQTLRDLWQALSDLIIDALQVDRVGIWLTADDGEAVICRYLSQRSSGQLFRGSTLRRRDFPGYFRALELHRAVIASDALNDPQTYELRTSYLIPLGITSMLDAPLYDGGRVVGVVCHEHVGTLRRWSQTERDFVMAVADNISRLYQEHLRLSAESALRGFEAHMAELHRMEAVGRMAAGIAHDFRGILSAMIGFTDLSLRARGLPAEVARNLGQVLKAGERGTRLIKEVTDFGKEEAVAPRVLSVPAALNSLLPMIRVMLGEHIALKLDLDSATSRVFMDASQLERAVLNLVLNARDAMPSGGELAIKAADAMQNHDGEDDIFVAISVSDTGTGMDDDTCKQILQPFFTTKGDQGTGLGLSIVDQVVTRVGGAIRFDSELGRGTTATIYLPRIAAAR